MVVEPEPKSTLPAPSTLEVEVNVVDASSIESAAFCATVIDPLSVLLSALSSTLSVPLWTLTVPELVNPTPTSFAYPPAPAWTFKLPDLPTFDVPLITESDPMARLPLLIDSVSALPRLRLLTESSLVCECVTWTPPGNRWSHHPTGRARCLCPSWSRCPSRRRPVESRTPRT